MRHLGKAFLDRGDSPGVLPAKIGYCQADCENTMPRVTGSGAISRAGVNRQFLLSTVYGLESHNRREEENDCWRQHRLEQSLDNGLPNATGERQQKTTTTAPRAHASTTSARIFWAEQKRRAMTINDSGTVAPGVSGSLERGRDGGMAGKRELSDNDMDDVSVRSVRTKHHGREKRKGKRKRKRESRDGGIKMENDAEENQSQHKRERGRHRGEGRDRDRTSTRKNKKRLKEKNK